ncbi:MAG TPA: LLM class flavin-dependent oxidoreductase [Candidatus Dormibacteraeota bacterium]|jgi:alkanesulfonate monooxygenase SsuD/methylene tetrahydromethanopterin reductase-like flavin-dependent oxidoreductase (luciferase family)|nr:LLM class flavin-dependent oxidoreductase [Candidatus Dormibacteraeota bacterium]
MKIGIGLPNAIVGTPGKTLLDWARRAEDRGFSSLATIGRVAYPSYTDLIALSAAAGATSRIGLMTDILLGPLYDPVLLAKDAASLDQLSSGRFTLGASVGNRTDDFAITGRSFEDRGRRWDRAIELMHSLWRGEPPEGSEYPVTPTPTHGERVPMLIGGYKEAVIPRIVKWGQGWTVGGAPPEMIPPFAEKLRAAWKEAGREGEPRIVVLGYFALGPNAEEGARKDLMHYYEWIGPVAEMITQNTPKSPEAIQQRQKAFEDIGIDELIWFPTIAEVDQVDMLAEVTGVAATGAPGTA